MCIQPRTALLLPPALARALSVRESINRMHIKIDLRPLNLHFIFIMKCHNKNVGTISIIKCHNKKVGSIFIMKCHNKNVGIYNFYYEMS